MNILVFFLILEKFLRPIYESLMAQLVKNLPAVRETWFLCPWGYEELNTTDQLTHMSNLSSHPVNNYKGNILQLLVFSSAYIYICMYVYIRKSLLISVYSNSLCPF